MKISSYQKFLNDVFCLQCARADMQTLTLGRYILERSLMDYRFTQQRDSKMAAASLLLALSIKKTSLWVGARNLGIYSIHMEHVPKFDCQHVKGEYLVET